MSATTFGPVVKTRPRTENRPSVTSTYNELLGRVRAEGLLERRRGFYITVFSLLTRVCHLKRAGHRLWCSFQMHLAFAIAVFNLLADWDGLREDRHGHTHLSLAEFCL